VESPDRAGCFARVGPPPPERFPGDDDFRSLYAYNRWADRRVLDACRTLTAEQYAAGPVPGWSSVRSSLVHIAVATEGWLRGLAGEPVDHVLTEAELPTVDDAARLLDRAHALVEGLLPTLTPEELATPRTGPSAAPPGPWTARPGRSCGTRSTTRRTTAVRWRPSSSSWGSSRRPRTSSSGCSSRAPPSSAG